MQKWFVFILAVIVLSGSSFPCCIEDNCHDELTISSSTGLPHEKGTCSPFFACATCSGIVQMAKFDQVPGPATQRFEHHEQIPVFLIPSYFATFFQPPRLSAC